jgi:quercetin dioxygenase-like cupin family protein
MTMTVEDLLVLPGQGRMIDNVQIAIGSEDTSGMFSAMKVTLAPYQLLAPHSHDREDQAVYVISGELEFEVGGADGLRFTVPAGSFVRKPAGIEHSFWNATDTPCDYIELSAGERFQQMVEATEHGALKAAIGSEKNYGVSVNAKRIPGMLARNGLTSVATMNMPWEGMAPLTRGD